MSWSEADQAFMAQAIALATGRMGETWPNPAVGCVIVKDGRVIAQAATAPGGRPHAEEQAVPAAGADVVGSTVYVTLEPCGARSSGRKSCAHFLTEAGVARVVIACMDPSPFAAGRGTERLRALALTVETGLAHFWSRSRQSLWKKGESSGHMLGVRDIRIDCDQDAVWVLAEPAGPTCHTGARSCFFRRIGPDGLSAVDEPGVDAAH